MSLSPLLILPVINLHADATPMTSSLASSRGSFLIPVGRTEAPLLRAGFKMPSVAPKAHSSQRIPRDAYIPGLE